MIPLFTNLERVAQLLQLIVVGKVMGAGAGFKLGKHESMRRVSFKKENKAQGKKSNH